MEIDHLPFEFNIGDALLNKGKQARMLNIMFNNEKVSSMLGLCDWIYQLPVTTDKPVYLPRSTIP